MPASAREEIDAILSTPGVRETTAALGFESSGMTPAELDSTMKAAIAKCRGRDREDGDGEDLR